MGTGPGPFSGLSVAALAGQLRAGATDPVALTEQALAAVDPSQAVLNAFVTIDHEGARAAAEVARDELASGVDRGPLHGLPVAVKDIVDTAGLVTTMGSRHFAGHVPAHDAEVVRRLRQAGAVIVGKTTTHEFAFGPTGDRSANGPAANPHDPTRMSGGSSAGSAAAVGAGLVPLAVGTDTGGSVRIPAALCGVVGIRPSMGRIPVDGVFPLSWSLDTVGVLAGDVESTAIGWSILAAAPLQPTKPGRLTIGVVTDPWFDRLDPWVRAAFATLLDRLAPAVTLQPVPVPDAEELTELYRTLQSAEAGAIHADRMAGAPELFDPEVRQRLATAMTVPAYAYAGGLRRLAELRSSAAPRLAGADLLLLPTVPVLAPPIGARDTDIGGGWTSPRDALLAHDALWGVLGLPALSVPIGGLGPGELPVGAQLVGRPGGDEALLAAARTVVALTAVTA